MLDVDAILSAALSLTVGVEYRFGGTRKAYWPWNPGKSYW